LSLGGPKTARVAESPSRESLVSAESPSRESRLRDSARLGQPCPTLPYWQSVRNIQIAHKFSQILTNEPQILIVHPYTASISINGCMSTKKWRPTPPDRFKTQLTTSYIVDLPLLYVQNDKQCQALMLVGIKARQSISRGLIQVAGSLEKWLLILSFEPSESFHRVDSLSAPA
jgi:hypothetical protein